jgi:hypothetical protein
MPASQSFLDNLENLRTVVSVALDHVAAKCEEFTKNATATEKLTVEQTISGIRTRIEALEKELHAFEHSISKSTSR